MATQVVVPTPTKEYVVSEHVKGDVPVKPNAALTDALNKRAGVAPQRQQAPAAQPEPKAEPNPETKAETPAPHVKFITSDEREPVVSPVAPLTPSDDKPPAADSKAEPLDLDKAPPTQLRKFAESAKAESHRIKEEMTAVIAERDLTKKELATYRDRIKAADDRVKSLESAEARSKELEARTASLDEQLRVTNYVQHPEFHEKFTKPLADAMNSAGELMKELVADPDGEPRQATTADFEQVLAAGSLTEAIRRAKELFGGDLANLVISKRDDVLKAKRARDGAVKDAALRSQEWQQQQLTRQAEARTKARTMFDSTAAALADKYPEIYRPPAGDKEAMEARASGEAIANLIVDGQPPDMSHETYLTNVAKVYHRAASFPMRELALHRMEEENKALKAKLAAYEKSEPSGGGRLDSSGQSAAVKNNDLNSQLRQSLERRARAPRR